MPWVITSKTDGTHGSTVMNNPPPPCPLERYIITRSLQLVKRAGQPGYRGREYLLLAYLLGPLAT